MSVTQHNQPNEFPGLLSRFFGSCRRHRRDARASTLSRFAGASAGNEYTEASPRFGQSATDMAESFVPCLRTPTRLLLGGCLLLGWNTAALAQPLADTPLPEAGQSQILAQRSNKYLVYVNGNSQLLLEQVRRIEPQAQLVQYEGRMVVQANVFYDKDRARQLEKDLKAQYIQAEIATIEERQQTPETPLPPAKPERLSSSPGYFVVIPADEMELQATVERVRLLGLVNFGVSQGDSRQGPYVVVGPFPNRDTAERWNFYLQDFGLENARVNYGNF